MIRVATPGDEQLVLALCKTPALGPRVEVDWRLAAENPRLPYQFYVVDEAAVLESSGLNATLLGGGAGCADNSADAADFAEELRLFLDRLGTNRLASQGLSIPGWRQEKPLIMARPAQLAQPSPAGQQHAAHPARDAACFLLKPEPTPSQTVALLQESGSLAAESADGFYADLCTRLNHGYARLCGAWQAEKLIATAGLYAITGSQAYLAAVETLPQYRRLGAASLLIHQLCQWAAPRPVTLLCNSGMAGFYRRLGFAPCGSATQSLRP